MPAVRSMRLLFAVGAVWCCLLCLIAVDGCMLFVGCCCLVYAVVRRASCVGVCCLLGSVSWSLSVVRCQVYAACCCGVLLLFVVKACSLCGVCCLLYVVCCCCLVLYAAAVCGG